MAVTCISNLGGGTGNWSSNDTWTIAGQGAVIGHGASIASTATIKKAFYPRRRLTERPEGFVLNKNNPLYGYVAFAGLGGMGFGTSRYHDSSLYSNHGMLINYTGVGNTPADQWSRSLGRASLGFGNATSDYASLLRPIITNDFTIAAWINVPIIASQSTNYAIFGQGLNVSDAGRCMFGVLNTSLTMTLIIAGVPQGNSIAITFGNWFHVAITRKSNVIKYYVNGVYGGTDGNNSAALSITNNARVGAYVSDYYYWLGKLSDVIVSKTVLSPSAIARLADPSNVMLDTGGGNYLILPPKRRIFSVTGGTLTANTGSGATLNITVASTVITGVTSIGSAGTGYPLSSIIRLRVTGGSGNCGIIEVDTNGSGGVSAFRSIIAGGTGYSATNAATTIDWTAWTSSALIGHKVKVSGTWYPISGNTTTALTLPGWPGAGVNNVSWTLGGTPLSGDSAFVGNGHGALFNITASAGAIIGAVNAVSYNLYPVSSTLNLGIFDPNSVASGGIISVLTNSSGGISSVLSIVSGGTGYTTKTNNSSAFFSIAAPSILASSVGEITSAVLVTVGSGYPTSSTINLAVSGNNGATYAGSRGILSVVTNVSGQISSATPVIVAGGISYNDTTINYPATNSYSTDTYDTVVFDVDISTIPLLNLTVHGTLLASTAAGMYHLKTTGAVSGYGTIRAGTDSNDRYPSNCNFIFTVGGTAITSVINNRFQLWAQKPAIRYCRLGSPFKTFTTSGGRGSGCTITITQTGGVITGHTLIAGGTLYPPSSTVYLNITNGSGTNGYISVQIDGSGIVSSINGIINGGTGYINTTGATTASYGVFHVTAHGYLANQPVRVFQGTGGLLPIGGTIAAPIYTTFYELTTLYIKTVIDANSFTLALTSGGTVLQISALSSGTNSITKWGELAGATTIDVKAYDLPDVNGGNGPSSYPMSEGTAIDLTSDPKWAGGASVVITKDYAISEIYTITSTSATTISIYPSLIATRPAFVAIGLITRNVVLNFINTTAANNQYTCGNIDAQINSIAPGQNTSLFYYKSTNVFLSFCGTFTCCLAPVPTNTFIRGGITVTDSFFARNIIYVAVSTGINVSISGTLCYSENGSAYVIPLIQPTTLESGFLMTNCVVLNYTAIAYSGSAKDGVITMTNCLSHNAGLYTTTSYLGKMIVNNCINQFSQGSISIANFQCNYFTNCQFNYFVAGGIYSFGDFNTCSFNTATAATGMALVYGSIYAANCTFNRIPLGLYECRGKLVNCTFNNGGVALTTDISQSSDLLLIGCTLSGTSQCDMVGKNSIDGQEKVVVLDIGGVSGSHKSWLTQGYIASDTGTPYGPLSSTLKFTPSSATFATYWDEQIYCPANKYTYIDVYMKQSATGMSEIPKCQLIDPSAMFLTDTPLFTISMVDNTNWQHFVIPYKPTYSRSVYLRIRGANATGNWWAGYVVRKAGQIVTQSGLQ